MSALQQLLRDCTVRISDSRSVGTGFFVAQDCIITCAHVVANREIGDIVQFKWREAELQGKLVGKVPSPYKVGSFPDVALIEIVKRGLHHPCVLLDTDDAFEARHPLYAYGYTPRNPSGESLVPTCEGEARRSDLPEARMISFREAQTVGGMSGAPLLDEMSMRVCGMIKISRNEEVDLGGYAIRAGVILETFPNLLNRHYNYHRTHDEWGNLMRGRSLGAGNGYDRESAFPESFPPKDGLSSNRLGSIHVHIDGDGRSVAESVLQKLGQYDESEFVDVADSYRHPQRSDEEKLYRLHTPGEIDGVEKLSFFSTTVLYDGPSLPSELERARIEGTIHRLLVEVRASGKNGVVVEAERVVGRVGEDNVWAQDPSCDDFFAGGFAFEKASYDPCYEIHLSVDIQRDEDAQEPLSLADLDEACVRLNIPVAGWFRFGHPKKWAYRSNAFSTNVVREKIIRYRENLATHFKSFSDRRGDARVRVIVEESLGVWKSPFNKSHQFLTVPELAEWERKAPSQFWVVAGNFLGDQDERVRQAMQSNLRGGTRYVYFLRSFADYQRWLKFRDALEKEMRIPLEALMSAYRVEVKWSNDQEREDCFIAWPKAGHRSDELQEEGRVGYELIRDTLTHEVLYGREMSADRVDDVVHLLYPVLKQHAAARLVSFLDPPVVTRFKATVAILQTGLFDDFERYTQLKRNYAGIFDKYDSLLATELSKLGAIVVYSTEGGYLIVYKCESDECRGVDESRVVDNAVQGTRTMIRLLKDALLEMGYPASVDTSRSVIDYGRIERSIRSGGFHYTGDAIDYCRLVMRHLEYGQLCITRRAWKKVRPDNGQVEHALTELNVPGVLPKPLLLPSA